MQKSLQFDCGPGEEKKQNDVGITFMYQYQRILAGPRRFESAHTPDVQQLRAYAVHAAQYHHRREFEENQNPKGAGHYQEYPDDDVKRSQ